VETPEGNCGRSITDHWCASGDRIDGDNSECFSERFALGRVLHDPLRSIGVQYIWLPVRWPVERLLRPARTIEDTPSTEPALGEDPPAVRLRGVPTGDDSGLRLSLHSGHPNGDEYPARPPRITRELQQAWRRHAMHPRSTVATSSASTWCETPGACGGSTWRLAGPEGAPRWRAQSSTRPRGTPDTRAVPFGCVQPLTPAARPTPFPPGPDGPKSPPKEPSKTGDLAYSLPGQHDSFTGRWNPLCHKAVSLLSPLAFVRYDPPPTRTFRRWIQGRGERLAGSALRASRHG
jgi:hypothetical protein